MSPRYAIFGNPVAHSRSPEIHAAFSAQTGIPLVYERRLAPESGFSAAVAAFRAEGGRGGNVTLPFKVEAYALASHRTPRATQAGAVNTLRFADGAIEGDNTDGAGLVADLKKNLGVALAGARILIVGAGGAARGVVGPLLAEHPGSVTIVNRTPARAEEIAAVFAAANVGAVALADLPGREFDLVINATAASLNGELPPVPRGAFASQSLAYEMMYGKGETPFLALARQEGARRADGLGMLVEQAAEAFLVWHGVRPDTAPVLEQLRLTVPAP